MKKICYFLILSIFFLKWTSALYAEKNHIRFDRLSVEDGLPHTSVYDILQDSLGFMWFATDDGVVRYDGYTFTAFKPAADNPKTINPGAGYALYEDRSGNIWIGLRSGGLNKYDPVTGDFTRYEHDPDHPESLSHNSVSYGCIYEDSTGILWIGTWNGLNRFDPVKQTFKQYFHEPDNPGSLSENFIRSLEPDPVDDRIIWIGTNDGGLNRFDRIDENFVRYQHDKNNTDTIIHNTVWDIYGQVSQSGKTVLWLCTAGGLDYFDTGTGKFTHFTHDPENPDSLSHNEIYSIVPALDNTFWLGTHGGGLNRFDPVRKTFVSYLSSKNAQSISSNIIHPLYPDRSGTLWIGTWGGGISRIDPFNQKTRLYDEKSGLSSSAVLSLLEDRDGKIWIGTWSGGLNSFDPKTGIFEHFRHDPDNPRSLGSDIAGCLYEDSRGILWVGTWGGGLNRFDRETKNFNRWVSDPGNPESISHNAVRGICEDESGNLWVGTTNGGVNRFDRADGKFVRYMHHPGSPGSISSNNIWSAFKDSSGNLWFTSNAGLNRFDSAQERFIRYHNDKNDPFSISSNGVINVYEDSQAGLWITTQFGLNRFDKVTNRFIRYSEEQGLPDNRIESICEDNEGSLWLGTGKGLCRFNPEKKTLKRYGNQTNLFFYPAAIKTRTGELWFGGPKGINVIDPKKIIINPHKPPVVLTGFLIDCKAVRPGEHSVLKQNIISAGEIVLPPHISRFGFEFSALNYTLSMKNFYKYKMEGFDKDWIFTASDKRFAHYTRLEPGKYIFRVKASNNDGVWNEEGASVKIIVMPPWWKTWWFKICFSGIFVILFFIVHRWRIYSIECRNTMLEEQVALRTAELQENEEKFRSYFNMSTVGMCITSPEKGWIEMNDRISSMLGYSKNELASLTWSELTHPDDLDADLLLFAKIMSGEIEFYELDKRFIRKDGTVIYTSIYVSCQRHPDKSVCRMLVSIIDISERKKAEELIKEKERLLSDIINFLPDATIVIDKQGKVLAWNRAMESMTGIAAKDMLGRGGYEYALPFYGQRRPILIDFALQASPEFEKTYHHIQRSGDSLTAENYYPDLLGKETWLFGNAAVLRDSQGEVIGAIESVRDITKSKSAEIELKKPKKLPRPPPLQKANFLPI
ncbi:two-component regulator propeller domain-containing protein [Desulfonema limicola]|uniref:two-component regulator propeller domain-containing protein n=1 Tax=Desulfonema limicola TaxID=45656 RepID=UPI001A9B20FD|nr:two-component regulator propeller domain-containing protein [Desulfonema limicola]